MSTASVRTVPPGALRALVPDLAEVLVDCVEGGASVTFMAPFTTDDAIAFWNGIAQAAEAGTVSVIVGEFAGKVMGTVQLASTCRRTSRTWPTSASCWSIAAQAARACRRH